MRPGSDRHADLQTGVRFARVLLPLGAGIDRSTKARGRRVPGIHAADREPLEQRPRETQIELVSRRNTPHVAIEASLQAHPDDVLAVDRKMMANREPAARPEREVLAHARNLKQLLRDVVRAQTRTSRRQPDREATHLSGRRHIPFQKRGRRREHIRDVVEPVDIGIVGGQQLPRVDLEAEQGTDGVRVFRAVESVDRRSSPRVGALGRRAVERGLQPGDQGGAGTAIRPGAAAWRHRVCAKLADDHFPHLGFRGDVRQVDRVERQPGRSEPLVVARDAIAVEERAVGRRWGLSPARRHGRNDKPTRGTQDRSQPGRSPPRSGKLW